MSPCDLLVEAKLSLAIDRKRSEYSQCTELHTHGDFQGDIKESLGEARVGMQWGGSGGRRGRGEGVRREGYLGMTVWGTSLV